MTPERVEGYLRHLDDEAEIELRTSGGVRSYIMPPYEFIRLGISPGDQFWVETVVVGNLVRARIIPFEPVSVLQQSAITPEKLEVQADRWE